ncbi:hypothetical protein PG988_004934 [Apiospora saccharicola]
MPADEMALRVLAGLTLLTEEPGEFIPARYRPESISIELAGAFATLVIALRTSCIPLTRIWAAPEEGGILIPLIKNQHEFSNAPRTAHLRPQIVKEAIKLYGQRMSEETPDTYYDKLWQYAQRWLAGIFTLSFAVWEWKVRVQKGF